MKIVKKNVLKNALIGAMALGLVGFGTTSQAQKVYTTTFYVAGMGGHFAKAEMTIDPTLPAPLQLHKLTRVVIGDADSHPTHDARIDNMNRNVMFWSTYHIDPATGMPHVGKTNLLTGKVLEDVNVSVPAQATHTHHMYCASAQTDKYFIPITMTNKAYIDVFRKSDLKHIRRVFLEGTAADIHKPYLFYHGTNSPDMKELFITINEAAKPQGAPIGKMDMFLLDMDALVNHGKVKVLAHGIAPGAPGKTMSFRQYFSPDGNYIANSGADRMYLIDAHTLKVLDVAMMGKLEENHDDIFTPDSKYIIATSRTKTLESGNAQKISMKNPSCTTEVAPKGQLGPNDYLMDGQLKLYDVKARKFIGKATSVCLPCHNEEGVDQHAVLCGIDANWKI
ncbi:MAG: WD40 repeat domain-containing protein [Deltaproteobacteria bacterium]|nr:WD40 repeat domain-containing protein [Deltaproteobacteria bacterium]